MKEPCHCLVWKGYPRAERRLEKNEISLLMKSASALMVRNLYDFDCQETTNFWKIIQDKVYEISDLPPKVRNMVRRCLKDCEVKNISNIELIKADGYRVYVNSYLRYHDVVSKPKSRQVYEQKLRRDSHFDIYGVFRKQDNRLIAYAWNVFNKDVVQYSAMKGDPEFLNKHYPFYGLIFTMTHDYLSRGGISYVVDGFRSITGHSNIQPFLENKFLFRKAYCRMQIIYKPWLNLIIKLCYPFRKIIPTRKAKFLLNLEQIRRE